MIHRSSEFANQLKTEKFNQNSQEARKDFQPIETTERYSERIYSYIKYRAFKPRKNTENNTITR